MITPSLRDLPTLDKENKYPGGPKTPNSMFSLHLDSLTQKREGLSTVSM